VRPAGTLIRDAEGRVKWIVYHGGALTTTAAVLATYCRAPADAVPVSTAEYAYYRASAALPPADPPCATVTPCTRAENTMALRDTETQKGRGDALLCVSTAGRGKSDEK
jgi:hypothetical protein